MSKYDAMNKTNLRAACKAAGISYGNMSVADMRAALTARATAATTPAPVAAPVVPHPTAAAVPKPAASKPAKVQRVQQNGITRPGPGKCLDVWEAMEALHAKTGEVPTAKDASNWASANGSNVSNAMQELSRWRKFSGLTKATKSGVGAAERETQAA